MSVSVMTQVSVTALPPFCQYRPGYGGRAVSDIRVNAYVDPPAPNVAFRSDETQSNVE